MPANESPSKRLVMFCEPPPFDKEELWHEEFVFAVCDSHSQLLCCQLLPCDVIVMTVEHAKSDEGRSCAGLRFGQRPPLLLLMAGNRTAVPEYMHPAAIVPERATASQVMEALRNLPRRGPKAPY